MTNNKLNNSNNCNEKYMKIKFNSLCRNMLKLGNSGLISFL